MTFMFHALLGLVVSLSFIVGAILYLKSKEEIDSIRNKYKENRFKSLMHFALVPVGLSGLVLAWSTVTSVLIGIATLIFIFGLLFGTFIITHEGRKKIKIYSIESVGSFLAFYFVILILVNLA